MAVVEQKSFGFVYGRESRLFTLYAGKASVSFCDFGCTMTDFRVPSRVGSAVNIAAGYPCAPCYALGSSFLGATVGRYAGRIADSRFFIDGREFRLDPNDGPNHLHGGFSKRFWAAESSGGALRFSLSSPDGDEGFPGALDATVTAELLPDRLKMTFEAKTDAPTHVNLTNHSYFNLKGGGDIRGHTLWISSAEFAELRPDSIPTGRLMKTAGTALDFSSPKPIGAAAEDPSLSPFGGIDHSFVLPADGSLRTAARLFCPETGITLACNTTQPSVHIYTANHLHLDACGIDRNMRRLRRHGFVCLEAQHLPNSPNTESFPSTLLLPGQKYREITEFVFGTE